MAANADAGSENGFRFEHLSEPSPAWTTVAYKQLELEPLISRLYNLPIEEFRKIPYKIPPLPANVPLADRDLVIREGSLHVRDHTPIKIRIYEPLNRGTSHLLFFNVHGGGWTTGTPESEEAQNRFIAVNNNAVVCSVDYRRAPEFPFPYALHDAIDALLWCKENSAVLGIDPHKIIIGGGSAGANVCAAMALISRDKGITGIIGQILNIPVTCHPNHFPKHKYELCSYEQNADAPIVNASRMRKFWANYLPGAQYDPNASPLLAESLKGLPPTLVQVAGMDPLRDEGLAYAQGLRDDGVKVSLKVYPGMPHAFYTYPDLEPSREYFQTMVDWISQVES